MKQRGTRGKWSDHPRDDPDDFPSPLTATVFESYDRIVRTEDGRSWSSGMRSLLANLRLQQILGLLGQVRS